MLIATLARYAKNKLPSSAHIAKYEKLLPDVKTINYLSYVISLSISLLSHKPRNIDFELKFKKGVLRVESEKEMYLAKEAVEKIIEIENFKVEF